jgi:hypothetical protein
VRVELSGDNSLDKGGGSVCAIGRCGVGSMGHRGAIAIGGGCGVAEGSNDSSGDGGHKGGESEDL